MSYYAVLAWGLLATFLCYGMPLAIVHRLFKIAGKAIDGTLNNRDLAICTNLLLLWGVSIQSAYMFVDYVAYLKRAG